MASILPNGKTQFIDQNGKPLAYGAVTFYAPGTTTKKDTWQDQAMTQPNTNPVSLDSRGQATIWGTGSYRQVVTDQFGAVIWDQVVSEITGVLSGPNGSSSVGFIQIGSGAVQRTAQDKMREPVSVKDFGGIGDGLADESAAFNLAASAVGVNGQVVVPEGTWKLQTAPTTAVTWLIDAQATLTGAATLSGRIMKFGNGGASSKGTKIGAVATWLEQLRPFTESIAEIAVLSTIGQIGIIGASRTSDFGVAGSQGCIGISGYANNNNATAVQTGYGGYIEARRQIGAGITQGLEIDIVNMGDTGIVYPGNVYPGNNMTSALWLASGGEVVGAQGASLAIGIIANGNNFDKGIVIQTGAVQVNSGEAVAVALGFQNGIVWYDGSTNKVARIRNDATAASFGIVFSNSTLNLQTMAGANVFTIGTNGVLNIAIPGGGYYFGGTQVVAARQGGWGTSSGGSKAAFNAATASPAQTAAAVAQLINDLFLHGLIGA